MNKSINTTTKYSPLSGYEPKYEPDRWNKNPNILNTHNCYSYSMNLRSSRKGKAQPDIFHHIIILIIKIMEVVQNFIKD